MSEPINGKTYLRALAYAIKAVPTDEQRSALQHLTFYDTRIVGADSTRRHDGHLPVAFDKPMSVTLNSARELVMALEYAHRVSKHRSGTFSVRHEGPEVTIEYGARSPLVHELQTIDVGGHPRGLNEWVPEDAPINPEGLGHISCGDLREVSSWWRSWEKDHGTCQIRGGQEGGPVRVDVTAGGQRVATAFVLPQDHPPAELRDTLPLFDGVEACGRSNLDLDLSGDGSEDLGAQSLKIGDVEINVTGLGDPLDLLVAGPCPHRETDDPCLPCTEEKVENVKRAKQLMDANEAPGGKKRGKRKKAPAPESMLGAADQQGGEDFPSDAS